MQTSLDDPYGSHNREFNIEMLRTQVFGAFFSVVQYRRNTVGMTNAEIAKRSDWSRSMITKTLGAPANWTLATVSELATALDVDFKFCLVDRTDRSRSFDANGLAFDFLQISQCDIMGQAQNTTALNGLTRPRKDVTERARLLQSGFGHLFPMESQESVNFEVAQP